VRTIEAIWKNPKCRPSLRSFREWQAQRLIPYLKIGRRVYFDPEQVRHAINKQCKVDAKK